jgi:hypothetical protein
MLEGVWRRGFRVECMRLDLPVCERSVENNVASADDIYGKQANTKWNDAGFV